LRHHPDPLHRLFLADALWCQNTWAAIGPWQGDGQDLEFLAAWALDEPDGRVLAKVLDAYTDQEHPGQEAIGLRYADHPDPRVRSQVPYCLLLHRTAPTEATVTTVLALSRDPDPGVRAAAARSLGARELLPAFREALLNLLQDPDHGVRSCAAVSLFDSDDRTAVVADALAALMDEGDQLFRASGLWHYRSRNRPTEHDRAAG
jgi:HEAT repeat protein